MSEKLQRLIEERHQIDRQINEVKHRIEVSSGDEGNSKPSPNRFLVMDFWEFAIVSTLMAIFFPWSLLYCLIVFGMEDTKLLVVALFHDLVKTITAICFILIPVFLLIIYVIYEKYGN